MGNDERPTAFRPDPPDSGIVTTGTAWLRDQVTIPRVKALTHSPTCSDRIWASTQLR